MRDFDKPAEWLYAALAAALLGLLLIAAANPRIGWMQTEPPPGRAALADWMMSHPADWNAASLITEQALDFPIRDRLALWRTAHAVARQLAPYRPHADVAALRSGLFHWHELPASDRRMVIDLAVVQLQDDGMFRSLAKPLWDLTHDIALLRRAQPHTLESLALIENLAVTAGRFEDYQQLRAEVSRARLAALEARKRTATAAEIVAAIPAEPRVSDVPLVQSALQELSRRPIETVSGGSANTLVDFALRRNLEPLDGLAAVVRQPGAATDPNRARLALRLGNPELAANIELTSLTLDPRAWTEYRVERALYEAKLGDVQGAEIQLSKAAAGGTGVPAEVLAAAATVAKNDEEKAGRYRGELAARFGGRIPSKSWEGLCGSDICTAARADVWAGGGKTLTIALETVQSDGTPPYVEIFADDALAAEGPVSGQATFNAALSSGLHRIEIRIANQRTRNMMSRRVRIVDAF